MGRRRATGKKRRESVCIRWRCRLRDAVGSLRDCRVGNAGVNAVRNWGIFWGLRVLENVGVVYMRLSGNLNFLEKYMV